MHGVAQTKPLQQYICFFTICFRLFLYIKSGRFHDLRDRRLRSNEEWIAVKLIVLLSCASNGSLFVSFIAVFLYSVLLLYTRSLLSAFYSLDFPALG